jgi:mono/diheme cytochrome c family protein
MRRWYAAAFGAAVMSSAFAGDGATLFTQNCALCHQSGGAGLPGQFPRLAGRVRSISAHESGRSYLIDVLTYGLSGTVTVDDQEIIGVMPPFNALADEAVADILSYVQGLGEHQGKTPKAFSAQEVAAGRAKPAKSPDEVQSERQQLKSAKVIP